MNALDSGVKHIMHQELIIDYTKTLFDEVEAYVGAWQDKYKCTQNNGRLFIWNQESYQDSYKSLGFCILVEANAVKEKIYANIVLVNSAYRGAVMPSYLHKNQAYKEELKRAVAKAMHTDVNLSFGGNENLYICANFDEYSCIEIPLFSYDIEQFLAYFLQNKKRLRILNWEIKANLRRRGSYLLKFERIQFKTKN